MHFGLTAMRYAVEVARRGSISKAAQELYISQPHLSNTIRNLEHDLGITIFERSAKGVNPTLEGATFLQQAANIVEQADSLEQTYYGNQEKRVRLRVSVTRSYRMIKRLAQFMNEQKEASKFNIRFKETNPFEVIEDVMRGESDFGGLHFFDVQEEYFVNTFKLRKIDYVLGYKRKFLLAVSKDSSLASEKSISKEMLKDKIAVAYGDYANPWLTYDGIAESSDLYLSDSRVYVYDRAGAMKVLSLCPNSYMWITGLSDETLERYGLVLKNCEDFDMYNIGVGIKLASMKLTAEHMEFWDSLSNIDWTEKII